MSLSSSSSLSRLRIFAQVALLIASLHGAAVPAQAQTAPVAEDHFVYLPVLSTNPAEADVAELTLDQLDAPSRRLSGGPLQWAGEGRNGEQSAWYLPADGRLVASVIGGSYGIAEPYPLDPKLGIRDIAYTFHNEAGIGRRGLLAATDNGIYHRDRNTFRWSKVSDRKALFISACAASTLWIVPQENPEQLLVSYDDGASWKDVSAGLRGRIATNVYRGMFCGDLMTVTVYRGRYEIYRSFDTQVEPWARIGVVPGAAFAASTGLPASIAGGSDTEGHFLYAGSSDGKIYRPKFDPNTGSMLVPIQWDVLQSFGPNKYPLFVNQYEVSLIDTRTLQIQMLRAPGADFGISGDFQPVAFPTSNTAWGASLLPDGIAVKRKYSAPNSASDISLMLGVDNSLWAYTPPLFSAANVNGITGGGGGGSPITRTATNVPAARQNLIVADYPNYENHRLLYSGATLAFGSNGTCTANDKGLYQSSDYGLTWTQISTGTARQPIAALKFASPDPDNMPANDDVLVSTCNGPSLSRDGGATWLTPAELNWPYDTGTPYWSFRMVGDWTNTRWTTLYATGILSTGLPYVLRGDLDLQPGLPISITWTNITPISATAPTALAISTRLLLAPDWCGEPPCGEAPPEVPYTLQSREIYIADSNTVWSSLDDGLTWQSFAAGLNGAKVLAINSLNNDSARTDPHEVLIIATNRGLMLRPRPDKVGPWIPTAQPYSKSPLSLELFTYPIYALNATDGEFDLLNNAFAYVEPSSPAPATCSNLLLNGSFEDNANWILPITPVSANYSVDKVYTGTRSMRMGVVPTGTNKLSYSTAYQFVTLPSDALTLTLRAKVWRGATDIDPDMQWMEVNDTGAVAQANATASINNDPLEQLRQVDGISSVNSTYIFRTQSNAQAWEPITFDIRPYRGKRIRLLMGVYNNGARGRSLMYADDVVIESCK